jgi:acyl carrier protein
MPARWERFIPEQPASGQGLVEANHSTGRLNLQPAMHAVSVVALDQRGMIDEVQALLLRKLSIRVNSPEEDLLAAGILDSLTLVRLITVLEQRFSMELPIGDLGLESFRSVAAMADTIQIRQAEAVRNELPAAAAATAGELQREVQALLREKLSIHVDDPSADLFQSGRLDSMLLVQLILEIEGQFGLVLPMEELDLNAFHSVDSITDLIARRLSPDSSRFS